MSKQSNIKAVIFVYEDDTELTFETQYYWGLKLFVIRFLASLETVNLN